MREINETRIHKIKERLHEAFSPLELSVADESHLHVGHAGYQTGKGHFALNIVAEAFTGKSLLSRHQAIYRALGKLMLEDIHALRIKALSPQEHGHVAADQP